MLLFIFQNLFKYLRHSPVAIFQKIGRWNQLSYISDFKPVKGLKGAYSESLNIDFSMVNIEQMFS